MPCLLLPVPAAAAKCSTHAGREIEVRISPQCRELQGGTHVAGAEELPHSDGISHREYVDQVDVGNAHQLDAASHDRHLHSEVSAAWRVECFGDHAVCTLAEQAKDLQYLDIQHLRR